MSRESIPVANVNEVCLPVWAGFIDLILPVVSLTSRDSQHSDLVWPDRRPAAGPQVHPQVPDGPFPAALADPAWVGRGRRTGQALPRLLSHSAATPLGTNHVSYQWLLLYNVSWMIGEGGGGLHVLHTAQRICVWHAENQTQKIGLSHDSTYG